MQLKFVEKAIEALILCYSIVVHDKLIVELINVFMITLFLYFLITFIGKQIDGIW